MATVALYATLVRKRSAHGGAGYVAGVTTLGSVPASREVEIRHRLTRTVLEVKFSNADGSYRFDDLDPTQLFEVRVRDWQGIYRDYTALTYPKAY